MNEDIIPKITITAGMVVEEIFSDFSDDELMEVAQELSAHHPHLFLKLLHYKDFELEKLVKLYYKHCNDKVKTREFIHYLTGWNQLICQQFLSRLIDARLLCIKSMINDNDGIRFFTMGTIYDVQDVSENTVELINDQGVRHVVTKSSRLNNFLTYKP